MLYTFRLSLVEMKFYAVLCIMSLECDRGASGGSLSCHESTSSSRCVGGCSNIGVCNFANNKGSMQWTIPWHWDQRQLARARLPLECHPLLLPTAVVGLQDGCPLQDGTSE